MLTKTRLALLAIPALLYLIYDSFLQIVSVKKKFSSKNWINFPTDLRNKVAIVTGSNTGIGYQTAFHLASFGATVILACRDISRGTKAADDINCDLRKLDPKLYPYAKNGSSIYLQLDLSDLVSVIDFSNSVHQKFKYLDILVNNAGANIDGVLTNNLSQLFQINYLGHFLLFRSLEDLLTSKNPHLSDNEASRVINLSSVMHHAGQHNYKVSAFNKYKLYKGAQCKSSYNDSKLYMHFLTIKINHKYNYGLSSTISNSSRPILAVSVNPGAVQSDIWRHVFFRPLFDYFTSFFFLSCKEGCATSVYAASAPFNNFIDYYKGFDGINDKKIFSYNRYMRADLPYLVPYDLQGTLARELFGPFSRPQFAPVSLPSDTSYMIDHKFFPGNFRGQIPTELNYYFSSREEYWKKKYSETNLLGFKEASVFAVNYKSLLDLINSSYEFSSFLCSKILDMSGLNDSKFKFLLQEEIINSN